jgi:hypothetical protein
MANSCHTTALKDAANRGQPVVLFKMAFFLRACDPAREKTQFVPAPRQQGTSESAVSAHDACLLRCVRQTRQGTQTQRRGDDQAHGHRRA